MVESVTSNHKVRVRFSLSAPNKKPPFGGFLLSTKTGKYYGHIYYGDYYMFGSEIEFGLDFAQAITEYQHTLDYDNQEFGVALNAIFMSPEIED